MNCASKSGATPLLAIVNTRHSQLFVSFSRPRKVQHSVGDPDDSIISNLIVGPSFLLVCVKVKQQMLLDGPKTEAQCRNVRQPSFFAAGLAEDCCLSLRVELPAFTRTKGQLCILRAWLPHAALQLALRDWFQLPAQQSCTVVLRSLSLTRSLGRSVLTSLPAR